MRACVRACMRACACVCGWACKCALWCMCALAHARTHTGMQTRRSTQLQGHACMRTNTAHERMHSHTNMCMYRPVMKEAPSQRRFAVAREQPAVRTAAALSLVCVHEFERACTFVCVFERMSACTHTRIPVRARTRMSTHSARPPDRPTARPPVPIQGRGARACMHARTCACIRACVRVCIPVKDRG